MDYNRQQIPTTSVFDNAGKIFQKSNLKIPTIWMYMQYTGDQVDPTYCKEVLQL